MAFKPLAPEEFKVLDDFHEPEKKIEFVDFLALREQVPNVIKQFVMNNQLEGENLLRPD